VDTPETKELVKVPKPTSKVEIFAEVAVITPEIKELVAVINPAFT
jgi:hypothetical protein